MVAYTVAPMSSQGGQTLGFPPSKRVEVLAIKAATDWVNILALSELGDKVERVSTIFVWAGSLFLAAVAGINFSGGKQLMWFLKLVVFP